MGTTQRDLWNEKVINNVLESWSFQNVDLDPAKESITITLSIMMKNEQSQKSQNMIIKHRYLP